VIEHLPSKCEDLSSNRSITRKKKKKKGNPIFGDKVDEPARGHHAK
jgi:hypothetical protein